jgi:hypothetical protein
MVFSRLFQREGAGHSVQRGIHQGAAERLAQSAEWHELPDGFALSPSLNLVLQLTPKARQNLYAVLAPDSRNEQFFPFLFRADAFDAWFAKSTLPSNALATVRRLIYTNGAAICFCDLGTFDNLYSTNETVRLVKTLSRVPAALLRVRITPAQDTAASFRYWTNRRASADQPVIESLQRGKPGTWVDVAELLPPFARDRVYTYPNPKVDPNAAREDCFWSSMNFFNREPDPRLLDFTNAQQIIRSEYHVERGERTFGDLIAFADAQGRFVHMCVYIADDVVFTKNGAHVYQPWVLMKMPDMLARYPADKPLQTLTFRRNSS